jgi:electron transport complex protein RnfB
MSEQIKNKAVDPGRRGFVKTCVGGALAVAAVGTSLAAVARRGTADDSVWQLDPEKCTQCGRCATSCVLKPSAVKCVHAYDVCGYCKLCGGYHQPNVRETDTAAENQLCPTAAITRTFIEDPYYEYTIIEDLCIGCAKCVKGCTSFGNGSLYLQVRHNICVNCNECAIARDCPAKAFRRVPAATPYILKGTQGMKKNSER